jgi:hypothetical protein
LPQTSSNIIAVIETGIAMGLCEGAVGVWTGSKVVREPFAWAIYPSHQSLPACDGNLSFTPLVCWDGKGGIILLLLLFWWV